MASLFGPGTVPSKASEPEVARESIDPATELEASLTHWLRCNFSNVSETFYTVSSLQEGSQYFFRVYAKNAAGSVSAAAELMDFVTCEDSSLRASLQGR